MNGPLARYQKPRQYAGGPAAPRAPQRTLAAEQAHAAAVQRMAYLFAAVEDTDAFVARVRALQPPPGRRDDGVMRPDPDDEPVLPARTEDETRIGWGEDPEPDDDERLRRERPPHWDQ
jgi:hypothetical protein